MRIIIRGGALIVSAAGVVILLTLAAHTRGIALPSGSQKDPEASALCEEMCYLSR
jgi:hypothetical protein